MENNLSTFGGRVRYLRGSLTQTEFAAYLGISKQNIWKYENKDSRPEFDILKLFFEKCNVNLNWLVMGKGSVYYTEGPITNQSLLHELQIKNYEMHGFINELLYNVNKTVEAFKENSEQ